MTDTRKEFEKHSGLSIEQLKTAKDHPYISDGWYIYHATREVWFAWQACQQLNDRKIADLLAVIKAKDEALKFYATRSNWSKDSQDYGSEVSFYNVLWGDDHEINQATKQAGMRAIIALALQPSDVELVEVATVNDHYSRDGYNDEISDFLPVDTKLYTINQRNKP